MAAFKVMRASEARMLPLSSASPHLSGEGTVTTVLLVEVVPIKPPVVVDVVEAGRLEPVVEEPPSPTVVVVEVVTVA
jgi:hypothetical protein